MSRSESGRLISFLDRHQGPEWQTDRRNKATTANNKPGEIK
jgi:hypothetical protein